MIGRNNFFFHLLIRVRVFCSPVKTTIRLFTLNESSVLTSRMEKHFIQQGIELWALFITSQWLNAKLFSYWSYEFENFWPVFTLAKTEGFGWGPSLILLTTKILRSFLFPIRVNIDGQFFKVDDCSLLNTEGFGLGGAFSSSLSSISSAKIC